MKFLVTDIEFDFDDDYPEDIRGNTEHICNNDLETYFIASNWDRQEIIDAHLGEWEADDEEYLIEEVTCASGWCALKKLNTKSNSNDRNQPIPCKVFRGELLYSPCRSRDRGRSN